MVDPEITRHTLRRGNIIWHYDVHHGSQNVTIITPMGSDGKLSFSSLNQSQTIPIEQARGHYQTLLSIGFKPK
jgi:hypothetical protein